jgi:hypothetical protein
MSPDERKRADRRDLWIASALVAAGLVISALSLIALNAHEPQQMAQAAQNSPPEPTANDKPAESKPGGRRPTTPAPEPAQPAPEAQRTGAQPALPTAPAEKVAPPIKDK